MRVTKIVVQAQRRRSEMSDYERKKKRKLLRELTGLHLLPKQVLIKAKRLEALKNPYSVLDKIQESDILTES